MKTMFKGLQGFTLTELLVTVGLIGLVSSIAIPAVLNGIETTTRRATFKDILKNISEATEALTLQGNVPADTYQALFSRFRFLDKNDTTRIITLHNGATLSGFATAASPLGRCDTILVDLNGARVPNAVGQDQVSVTASWEPNNGNACGTVANPITGGMVRPTAGDADNIAFYRELTR